MVTILKQMLASMQRYQIEQEKLVQQIVEILKEHGVEISQEDLEKEQKEAVKEKQKENR